MELEQAALFSNLSRDVITRIETMARVEFFCEDETIFSEGDVAKDLFVVRSGEVELTYTLPQDAATAIRITHVSPGEDFAWASLAQGETLSSRARAVVATSVFVIPARKLHGLFYEYPFAGYQVMSRLSQEIFNRLRETRKELRWLHQSAR